MMRLLKTRLSRNTFALLLSNGGSALLSFGLSVLIGRVLGETGLGVYAAALAWVFPLSLLAEMGIGTLITRDVAQQPDSSHAYVRQSVLIRLVAGGGLLLCLWSIAPFLSNHPQVVRGIRVSAPLLLIQPLYSTFTAIFRARQVMQPIAYLNLGMLIAQVSLSVVVLWNGYGIIALFVVNLLTSAGQLVAAWGVYRMRFYAPAGVRLPYRALMRRALPFAVAAVLAAVQLRLTIILLERFASTAEVGLYAAAARFVEAGRMLPHAFFDALFPLLAGMAAAHEKFERFFRRVMIGLMVFGLLFGAGITLIDEGLIDVTYGDRFSGAVPVLWIAAWGLLPLLLKQGRTLYWYAQGHEQFVNVMTVLVIVCQALIGLWLIPRYGAEGAALTALLAESIGFLLLWLLSPRSAKST
jgi:O-antigen/teichoic acid export membrane protein